MAMSDFNGFASLRSCPVCQDYSAPAPILALFLIVSLYIFEFLLVLVRFFGLLLDLGLNFGIRIRLDIRLDLDFLCHGSIVGRGGRSPGR